MVDESRSLKIVDASSKLMPCLARFVLSLFGSHSNFSAIVRAENAAESEHAQARRALTLLIEGQVQNSDGVVLIKAREIKPLPATLLRSDAGAALVHVPAMQAQSAADAALLAGTQAGENLVGSESHDFH